MQYSRLHLYLMAQNQTVTSHPHSFSLQPLRPLPNPTTSILYHFQQSNAHTPPSQHHSHQSQSPALTLPVFNQDKTHYTPTFILPLDSNYYKLNSAFEGQKFEEKVGQANHQLYNQPLYMVLPDCNFCQICRQTFTNYPDHIGSYVHLQLQKKTPGNRYLTQLCQIFARQAKAVQKKEKTRPIQKEPVNTRKVKKKLLPHPSQPASLQLTPNTHSHSQQ